MPTVNAVTSTAESTLGSIADSVAEIIPLAQTIGIGLLMDDELVVGTTGTGSNTIGLSSASPTSTGTTWPAWNREYIATAATWSDTTGSGTSSTGVTNWTTQRSYTATSAATDAWIVWNRKGFYQTFRNPVQVPRVQISDEEYQARQRRQDEAQLEREARYATERAETARAKERAQILLREHLTQQQKAELAEQGFFTVTVIDSKTGERRNYRIKQGRAGNVEQVDANGNRIKRFCIHPAITCPDADTMLAQKLWLEHREAEFLRVANHS